MVPVALELGVVYVRQPAPSPWLPISALEEQGFEMEPPPLPLDAAGAEVWGGEWPAGGAEGPDEEATYDPDNVDGWYWQERNSGRAGYYSENVNPVRGIWKTYK